MDSEEKQEKVVSLISSLDKIQQLFTERELNLIANCDGYALNNPAGLPGHNLMIIIHKLDTLAYAMSLSLTDEQLHNVFEGLNELTIPV